ncbi:MAG: nuclear transport factor 2 family protein [Parvularculaceae bacterium]
MAAALIAAPLAQASEEDRAEIEALLAMQMAAWNAGDIETFMEGYWKSDALRFASGGDIVTGWQATIERYRRAYPDRAAMGRLTFDLYEIDVVSDRDAFVFGRFTLDREEDRPTGLFTLRLRKFGDEWLIVSDHTSSAASD